MGGAEEEGLREKMRIAKANERSTGLLQKKRQDALRPGVRGLTFRLAFK